MRRCLERHRSCACLAAIGFSLLASSARAQEATPSTARCDSIVAASRADSVAAALFLSVVRVDDGELSGPDGNSIVHAIAAAFIAPRPFRLSVFNGPVLTRILRARTSDTTSELQTPTVTGVYRVNVTKAAAITRLQVVRASLMPGFDSAAVAAIQAAATLHELASPAPDDSMRVEVRFSTDSLSGARRLISATFPRMPIVNTTPLRDNPPPIFPEEEKGDSTTTGDVLLRFVVDRDGKPFMETVELVRATSLSFVRAALAILPKQKFTPATIHGCAVSQRVDYPFTFAAPPAGRQQIMPDGVSRH